jgi:malate dehydrogenase (oxaloacetate-decarboxylating)(NADP+)
MRILKQRVSDQKILFLGAGSAATGIANLIVDAMVEEGTSIEEARKRIALFDSKGLVTKTRGDTLAPTKVPFAQDCENVRTFVEAVRTVRPTAIIGVSAQPSAFNEEVIAEMSRINERPIIFALSNPTSKAECTAEEAYRWSNGKCLFACGSPFPPVSIGGRTFVPRQGNNSYVFPGIGLGCIFAKAKTIPEGIFLTAAKTLADQVSDSDLANGSLYPALSEVRNLSAGIATAVAAYCFDHGLAQVERPADLHKAIVESMWSPEHPEFRVQ